MSLNIDHIRQQFPALNRQAIYFDNPGGTQIAKPALDRINDYLVNSNANHAGAFATSQHSDAIITETRQTLVDFFNANRAQEIVFGANMTSLTFKFSRALARTWEPGDSIVVTRLDHDANVTPWVMAAEERGCQVQQGVRLALGRPPQGSQQVVVFVVQTCQPIQLLATIKGGLSFVDELYIVAQVAVTHGRRFTGLLQLLGDI